MQQLLKSYEYRWDFSETELFNIEFVIISTLGRAAETTITPQNFAPQGRVNLRLFAENHGEQYVALNPVENPDISNESLDSEVKKNYR